MIFPARLGFADSGETVSTSSLDQRRRSRVKAAVLLGWLYHVVAEDAVGEEEKVPVADL